MIFFRADLIFCSSKITVNEEQIGSITNKTHNFTGIFIQNNNFLQYAKYGNVTVIATHFFRILRKRSMYFIRFEYVKKRSMFHYLVLLIPYYC